MTPYERTRALWMAREFLVELCDYDQTPSLPRAVRTKGGADAGAVPR